MVMLRTSDKIITPKLILGDQGQWRAGPMNRIIFQPDGTRMVPIFHYSNCERSELFWTRFGQLMWCRSQTALGSVLLSLVPIY